MSKKTKFMKLAASAAAIGMPLFGFVVSCGNNASETNKEIVIAVDGVQKDFYNEVKAIFDKSKSAAKGFKIRFIEKDVFGALDFDVAGATDTKVVSDIFYAPQDRVTTLVQKGSVVPLEEFDSELFTEVAKQLGATPQEVEQMRSFGQIDGIKKVNNIITPITKLYAIRHNTEGIVLASNKTESETRAELKNENTDTLAELVKEGKAIFRIQDFWYGNGVLAGAFKQIQQKYASELTEDSTNTPVDLMKKILYNSDELAKASSGFIQASTAEGAQIPADKYNKYFKEALGIVSKIYYPLWEAAYKLNEAQFAESVWAKKGISQGDLKAVLSNDMGSVQNKIFELMKNNKINYAIVGTWDIQNAQQSGNAQSFFNVINVTEESSYLQAAGSWSYLINIRNANASKERREAFKELIKAIFTVDAYKKYFKKDSKVPFVRKIQGELKKSILQDNAELDNEIQSLMTELGYRNIDEYRVAFEKELKTAQEYSNISLSDWSTENDHNDPLAESNLKKASSITETITASGIITQDNVNEISEKIKDQVSLRNAEAAILGLSDVANLTGDGQTWQLGKEIVKLEYMKSHQELVQNSNEDSMTLHVRKVEKLIFGANGDNSDEKDALYDKIAQANSDGTLNNLVDEVKNKALEFAKQASTNSNVDEEKVKRAAELYFNSYVNTALIRQWSKSLIENNMALKKDQTPSNIKVSQVIEKIAKYDKSLSVNVVLNVLTSTKSLQDNGIGILESQSGRIDGSNPQYGVVWGNWNDQTFGNKVWLESLAGLSGDKEINSIDKFTDAVASKLSDLFSQSANAINESNSSTNVVIN
ncbi:hypothetical protein [Mycoplasmopsis gallinacea]|uniref:Lipoprotein n=1 Tax=Mycoplasmopsis gallinacea TaxID=29556 RepID=A0A6H0V0Z5_9BACT|nr:hypothetical protein [Mycoplasmopsis gallinacea]QIW62011.1 hypothetical protein GOQ20_00820 [Mycoplasmopsis gallinacea]